jgi:hypothetical protein
MMFVVTSRPTDAPAIGASLSAHDDLTAAVRAWVSAILTGHPEYRYAITEQNQDGSLSEELSSGAVSVGLRAAGIKLSASN